MDKFENFQLNFLRFKFLWSWDWCKECEARSCAKGVKPKSYQVLFIFHISLFIFSNPSFSSSVWIEGDCDPHYFTSRSQEPTLVVSFYPIFSHHLPRNVANKWTLLLYFFDSWFFLWVLFKFFFSHVYSYLNSFQQYFPNINIFC